MHNVIAFILAFMFFSFSLFNYKAVPMLFQSQN